MDGVSVGKSADYAEEFARRLLEVEEKEPEFKRRRNIADDMFHGNYNLLDEGFTFEEMFDIFDEHLGERYDGGIVFSFGDTIASTKSRKRFSLW